jgi:hypothetical protein
VAPAPETTIAVTTGPTWVTDASAAPAPDRSPAPTSISTMLSVKTMSTVYGIDSTSVGTIDTRATNQIWSSSSRHANGGRTMAANVSPTRTTKSPMAKAGLVQAFAVTVDCREDERMTTVSLPRASTPLRISMHSNRRQGCAGR